MPPHKWPNICSATVALFRRQTCPHNSLQLNSRPHSPPDLAPRPRLVARLAEGLAGQLTLLSAPAGAGKTTLINAWRASESGRWAHLAWLLLDDDDNDPVRFLTYLSAALDTFRSGIEATVLSLLQSPQPPEPKLVMTALINALGELPVAGEQGFYVLVLDDYHVITAQPIHDALAHFLAHLPAHVRLVIGTRADPPFPLARLRARHQLTEIRTADLAFTPEEAALFLNQVMYLALSPEQVAALTERTEGWIAGLQLAALSLRGRDEQSKAQFISGFTGNNEYIVDFLMEEVLAHEPEQAQLFLLYTSLLQRLTGALCDALTGRTDGQRMLEMLEKRALFLIALDSERRWYRYHQLFADVLRSRLQQVNPGIIPQLHGRAADWYEQQGSIAEAVNHVLAAGERARATRLLERSTIRLLMRGELITLQHWFGAIEQWVYWLLSTSVRDGGPVGFHRQPLSLCQVGVLATSDIQREQCKFNSSITWSCDP